jgi:hypothetical protein
MCYGDTITVEVSALNHGITDLNNATQVVEAINEGRAVARVVAVEHWTDTASLGWWDGYMAPALASLALPLAVVIGLAIGVGFVIYIWPHSEVPKR